MDKFWYKNLIIIWISQFTTMVAMNMIIPFLSLYIRSLGITNVKETAQWGGYIFSAAFILSFFFVPIWGYLGDKYGRKKMLIRAIFGLGISQLLMGLSTNVYHLLFARIIQGLLSGFLPASLALVASNTPSEKTGFALGLLQSATSAGVVIGPLVGGFLSDTIGFKNVFFLVSFICFINGIFIIAFVKEFNRPLMNNNSLKFIDNFRYIKLNKIILFLLLCLTLAQISLTIQQPVFPLFIEKFLESDKFLGTYTGLIFGVAGMFLFLSAPIWGRINNDQNIKSNLILSSILISFAYFIHYFSNSLIFVIVARIFLGIGLGCLSPTLFTLISRFSPIERKGGILSFGSSAQILGNLIGPTFSGAIAFLFDIKSTFIFAGIFTLIVSLIIKIKIPTSLQSK